MGALSIAPTGIEIANRYRHANTDIQSSQSHLLVLKSQKVHIAGSGDTRSQSHLLVLKFLYTFYTVKYGITLNRTYWY